MGEHRQSEPLSDDDVPNHLVHAGESLDRLDAGFLVVDGERISHSNTSAARILGCEKSTLSDALLDQQLAGPLLAEAVEGVRETNESHEFDGYDDSIDGWVKGSAYSDGGRISVVFEDITETVQLQRELKREEVTLTQLHEIVVDNTLSIEQKVGELLSVGADRLGTSHAFITRIQNNEQEILWGIGDHPQLSPGAVAPLSEAYCRYTIDADGPLAVADTPADGWENDAAYQRFGLDCYLGATITVEDEQFGTVCFVDTEPREEPFTDRETTFAELLTDLIHYLIEQQIHDRQLEAEQAFTESLLDSVPDLLFAYDESGSLIRWNEQVETVTGYTSAELQSKTVGDFVAERYSAAVYETFEAIFAGEHLSREVILETKDERQIPYQFSGAPLRDETGSIIGAVGVGRDISAQIDYQERLAGLLDTTRSLMQARDRKHVAKITVNAARELLGFDINVFRLYDSETETLEPVAATDQATDTLGERPVYEIGSGNPGEVFATGEPRILSAVSLEEIGEGSDQVGSAMYYPVGVHGTISVCATEPDAFDETDEQMLALLATSAGAACMRAKREQQVREAQEHTERILERVNGLIENTIEVLVQATTRDELEEGVVSELAAADPYTFAWIAQPDLTSEILSPTTWAGAADLPIRGQTFDLNRTGDPVSDAYRDASPHLITDLENRHGPWNYLDSASDAEAVLVVPLVYKETTYGILAVCTDDVDALDERERVVIEALGRAVANAINAVERGRILDATEVIELEFAVTDDSLLFSRLSAGEDCEIEVAGTEYRTDGSVRLYLSVTEVDPASFVERLSRDEEIQSVTSIVEHDRECLVEVTVGESLLATLTEYGAVPQAVVASSGTTRFTVELPYDSEARELYEFVQDRYPGTDLLGYHERERQMVTRQDFKAAISDRLTDRQETALRTAYLGGFFDWPRGVDGNELADAMDISRPTFHQHLRAAQGKVFEELFD